MTTVAAAYAKNLNQFKIECAQAIAACKNYGRTMMATDIGAITTALGTDLTKRASTLETPVAALRIGLNKSLFSNKILWAINRGKAANITAADMNSALTTALTPVLIPKCVATPYVSGNGAVGQMLSCTMGIWTNVPSSYSYAWQRAGVPIGGATSPTYTLVAGDSTKAIGCIVSGTNGAGTAAAPLSNTILCA